MNLDTNSNVRYTVALQEMTFEEIRFLRGLIEKGVNQFTPSRPEYAFGVDILRQLKDRFAL